MSEWIRHRGSSSMPKCLLGKRFEVRLRGGEKYIMHSSMAQMSDMWKHDGWRKDIAKANVMAYRILGDINPPDYSKGFPVGTTAKDIGAKVGDEFVVIEDVTAFRAGEIVTMDWDDGTAYPRFTNGLQSRYIYFTYLAPIPPKTAIELQAEEAGIPEPVQEWPEDRMDVIGQNGNDGLHYDAVPTNKYQRNIKCVTVDVYDVLAAFGVTCQARGHAIKKLLMAGQRGHKDEAQDLREAMQAIERSIQLAIGDK